MDEGGKALRLACSNLPVRKAQRMPFQQKSPFELLEKEPSGAYENKWWAITDSFVTKCAAQTTYPTVPTSDGRGLCGSA